jgi:hypothetical protein
MEDNGYGGLLGTLTQFLDEIQFKYAGPWTCEDEGGHKNFRVDTDISLNHGWYKVIILGDEARKLLGFYTVSGLSVPPRRRAEVAEFITRVNYGMSVGNFELGFDDGEVRFKTSIPADGTPLNYSLLRTLLYTCAELMDSYNPMLEAVVVGETSPKEADVQMRRAERTEEE